MAARTAAVNQLKALVVSAPEDLRAGTARTHHAITQYRLLRMTASTAPPGDVQHRATGAPCGPSAQRVQALKAEARWTSNARSPAS